MLFFNVSFTNIMVIWLHLLSSGTIVLQGMVLTSTFYSVSSGNMPPSCNSCVQLLPKYNTGKKKGSITQWRLLGRTFNSKGLTDVLCFWKTLIFISEVTIRIVLNVYFHCLLGKCRCIFEHIRQKKKVNDVVAAFEM